MCGISGIIGKDNRRIEAPCIERINDLASHRGPDGKGYFFGSNFALGHRRLSILDLSNHGLQPMVYGDRFRIIYNGEIYNYVEIRRELEALGYTFRSGTDTEVILAAFANWGPACCTRFNGMWAFAIHDALEQSIFFARDRFGVKPLYYIDTADVFAFGSEIKQLLPLLPSTRANRDTVVEWLLTSFEGHTTETFFAGVHAFPQGHYATYDLRNHHFTISRYYELQLDPTVASLSEDDATERFHSLFEDSVRIRLRSDVRVGTCLSGGLDSSATSAVGSRLYHAQANGIFLGIHAKSTEPERDESEYARIAAKASGIDLHVVTPKTSDFFANMDELIVTQEEPFGSPSMFMGWHVFQKAKEVGCKVMLNGQGGDEVLLGYERYFASFLRSMPLTRFAREAVLQARHSKLTLKDVIMYNFYFTNPSLRIARLKKRSFLLPSVKDGHDFAAIRRSIETFRNPESLQIYEISAVQLPHLLRYEDRNSMRHSIETRLPFLDYRLVEFAISLPLPAKIRNGWTKYILRRAMREELPQEVVWRRDKMGFEAPEETWIGSATSQMKAEIAGSELLGEITQRRRLVNQFDSLPLRRKWAYFMVAAWERKLALSA